MQVENKDHLIRSDLTNMVVKLAKIQKELNIVNQHTSSIQNIETQIAEQFPRLDAIILTVNKSYLVNKGMLGIITPISTRLGELEAKLQVGSFQPPR